MKRIIIYPLITLILFSSCAYFNTFYNAKQYYKKGYEATRKNLTNKPTSSELNNYQLAIDKSLTLIVEYPKSKYVDDALLLSGKAYYYRAEYFKAQRKFLELTSNYPNSDLAVEGKLWMARTQFALDEFEEAERTVNDLVAQQSPKHIKGQAFYYLGKFYERNRNFEEAASAYRKALDFGLADQKAQAWFSLGTSLDTLGRFEDALKAFKEVAGATYVTELEFEGEFRYAESLKKMGKSKEALKLFETLMGDEKNTSAYPRIKLQIANCLFRNGEADESIGYYDEITIDHERSDEAAQAYYEMGKIYEKYFGDYDRALDNYLKVKKESSRSEYADTADVLGRDIQRLEALVHVVNMGIRGETGEALELETDALEEDTLTLELCYDMMDTTAGDTACYHLLLKIGGVLFADSVFEEKNKTFERRQRDEARNRRGVNEDLAVDWREWVEKEDMPSFSDLEPEFNRLQKRMNDKNDPLMANNPELTTFRVEELDRNLFLLAELYRFRFNAPDSAFTKYEHLVQEFPDSPYAPKALFNMANMYETFYQLPEQATPIYEQLAEKYSSTRNGRKARQILGLPVLPTQDDTIKTLFANAESLLLEHNDPREAFHVYDLIHHKYGHTEHAPKAIYAKGWIYEHKLDSLERALTVYDSLISWYPESPFSLKVTKKVSTTKQQLANAGHDSSAVLPDSLAGKMVMRADSLGQDSLMLANVETPLPGGGISEAELSTEEKQRRITLMQDIPENLDLMARRRRTMRLQQMIPDPEAMNN